MSVFCDFWNAYIDLWICIQIATQTACRTIFSHNLTKLTVKGSSIEISVHVLRRCITVSICLSNPKLPNQNVS